MINTTSAINRSFKNKSKILTGMAALALPIFSLQAQNSTPAPDAPAQEQTLDTATGTDLSQMVVTGSYLTGAAGAGALPVKTITADEIAHTGAATISDVLQRIPQNGGQAFSPRVNTGLSFSPGASSIALRGLKEDATLVLVNGMRMPYFPQPQSGTDSFVDLNSIPLAAIDRVEVLKEGASSIYGTDAIAGVVNIILKDGYDGTLVETYYGNTTRKDMSTVRESVVSGFTNDRLSIMATAEYFHQNALADQDRPYSANADHRNFGLEDFRSTSSNYAFIEAGGGLTVPRGNGQNLNSFDLQSGLTPTSDFVRKFNTNAYSQLIPEMERYGAYASFDYKLVDHVSFYSNAFFNHSRTEEQIAPTPIFESDTLAVDGQRVPITVPANNPYNPFGALGVAFPFRYRVVHAGPRRDIVETYAYRLTNGFRFTNLPNNWVADVNFLTSESKSVTRNQNGLAISRVQDALNSSDPDKAFNIFGTGSNNSSATINGLKADYQETGLTRLTLGSFNARGDTFNLPAGPVQLAFGTTYNDENYRLQPSQNSLHGDIVGSGGASGFGKRNTKGVYYEIGIPIVSSDFNWTGLDTLTLNTSGRFDEYTDFGDVFKPKFSILLKPIKPLALRASYSEGYRAPSLPELFTSAVGAYQSIADPEVGGAIYEAPLTVGGNSALRPETSYSYDVGFTLDVPFAKGLSVRSDFFRIEQRNVVNSPDPQFVVDNAGLFPGAITRGGGGGQITNINVQYENLGKNVVDGVDLGLDYVLPTKYGKFTASFDATYNNTNETVFAPNTPNTEIIGTLYYPRFKATTEFDYEIGGFTLANIYYYTGDYLDGTPYSRRVGAFTTVDLQLSYEFFKDSDQDKAASPESDGKNAVDGKSMSNGKSANAMKDTVLENHTFGWQKLLKGVTLTVGCNNIADENPPYTDTQEGYDTTNADPTGRFYYVSLSKKF